MKRFCLIVAILVAMGSACSRESAQLPAKPVTMQQKTESIGNIASRQATSTVIQLPSGVLAPAPKPDVFIVDHWFVRHPSGSAKDLVAITFVVRNTSSKKSRIKIVCNFANDGSPFGESASQMIDAGSDTKLMVRGFWRRLEGSSESFDCRLESVK
jgi:hypothetical protein